MDVISAMVRLGRAEPMTWNAALEGAKTVTSLRESTAPTSLAAEGAGKGGEVCGDGGCADVGGEGED